MGPIWQKDFSKNRRIIEADINENIPRVLGILSADALTGSLRKQYITLWDIHMLLRSLIRHFSKYEVPCMSSFGSFKSSPRIICSRSFSSNFDMSFGVAVSRGQYSHPRKKEQNLSRQHVTDCLGHQAAWGNRMIGIASRVPVLPSEQLLRWMEDAWVRRVVYGYLCLVLHAYYHCHCLLSNGSFSRGFCPHVHFSCQSVEYGESDRIPWQGDGRHHQKRILWCTEVKSCEIIG